MTERTLFMLALVASMTAAGAAQGTSVPVPRPFPGSATPPATPSKPPSETPAPQVEAPAPAPRSTPLPPVATPPPAAAAAAAPGSMAAKLGVPMFPSAEFLEDYDAGSGQRYYLFGTNAAFADIVAYYKNVLKSGGREIYRAPATQQFDLGRYQEDTMAYPPSVVVKDYTWNNSTGYLFIAGTTEKRFKTVIQVVPPAAATTR